MRILLFVLAAAAALPGPARAGDWTGTGELGFAYARGNSTSDTFNAKGTVKKEEGAWLYEAGADMLRVKGQVKVVDADGDVSHEDRTTANRYGFGGKAGYKFSPKDYVFGSVRYDNDDFASYEWQMVASAGFGHQFVKDARTELSMEVGPGYRRLQPIRVAPAAQPDTADDLVARGACSFKHKLTDTTDLSNVALVESGGGRTFAQNDLGAAVKINAHFSLKAGFQLRYNSATPDGTVSTDRLVTTNVVYGF